MINTTTIKLAEQVAITLQSKSLFLAVAESCTGGGICQALTEIPGSSEWFDCGFITYSNSSKAEILDISAALLAEHGAVSEEIAAAMAKGALANSEANVAISTTGIAGPGGAVPGKPVGTVCFAWLIEGVSYTERKVFSGDRQAVREQTIEHSLTKLHRLLALEAA